MKEFEDLKTSTSTVMIYTNILFHTEKIFYELDVQTVDVPLTKKQKNVDKKNMVAPYGSIISTQYLMQIRGVNLRKKKKHWCTFCMPHKTTINSNGVEKESNIKTITEYIEEGEDDVSFIMFYCSECDASYYPSDVKKINHFLNQLTIVLSIGTHPMLNIMLFKDNMKIAGCKNVDDAIEAVLVLWQDYILPNRELWELAPGHKTPKFQMEGVMRNVDFKIGFSIDRGNLNLLLNEPCYSDKIFMSQYESTSQPNVNIKMFSSKPKDHVYECLVVPFDRNPYMTTVKELTYKTKKKKDKPVTAIVFSSSEVILSGKYDSNMKDAYEFLVKLIIDNKKRVAEVINSPNEKNIAKIARKKITGQ